LRWTACRSLMVKGGGRSTAAFYELTGGKGRPMFRVKLLIDFSGCKEKICAHSASGWTNIGGRRGEKVFQGLQPTKKELNCTAGIV